MGKPWSVAALALDSRNDLSDVQSSPDTSSMASEATRDGLFVLRLT